MTSTVGAAEFTSCRNRSGSNLSSCKRIQLASASPYCRAGQPFNLRDDVTSERVTGEFDFDDIPTAVLFFDQNKIGSGISSRRRDDLVES